MRPRNGESITCSPDRWNRLGVRRALRGDWRAARACFERAVAGRGHVVEFWVNLGVASFELDDEDTGRGALEVAEALGHRPRSRHSAPRLADDPLAEALKGVVNE